MTTKLTEYFSNIARAAKKAERGMAQQIESDTEINDVQGKQIFKRTILMPDSESAKEVAETPKLSGAMHIMDEFLKNLKD